MPYEKCNEHGDDDDAGGTSALPLDDDWISLRHGIRSSPSKRAYKLMWSFLGLALALIVATAAWRRSAIPGGYYDGELYAMTSRTHRLYALTSLAFAACFALTCALRIEALAIAALTIYAVIAALYGTSFLRGAADYHE
jgi:hypothetical protein